jgi:micrococcal nuclease
MLKRENIYKHIKSRLIGVNCPEDTTEHETFGKEATEFTKKSLLKKYVYIEKDKQKLDQYGRNLLYVWLEKPTQFSEDEIQSNLFNAIILKEGYARLFSFEPNVKYHNFFVKFENEAKQNKRGMWALKEYQSK